MLAFLVRRLLTLALTAWLATLVVFAVLEAIPGDPALVMLGTSAQPEAVAALRAQMGLDRPWPVRYAGWVGGMLHGDFGTSLTYARPVAGLVPNSPCSLPPPQPASRTGQRRARPSRARSAAPARPFPHPRRPFRGLPAGRIPVVGRLASFPALPPRPRAHEPPIVSAP
ncbi:hypothetical protein GBZ26_25945, partial [Azospirillum formosense]|nr:hypothetical protein [Azospirillum formosense]